MGFDEEGHQFVVIECSHEVVGDLIAGVTAEHRFPRALQNGLRDPFEVLPKKATILKDCALSLEEFTFVQLFDLPEGPPSYRAW